ncbi:hypothetical protein ACDT24_14370, partial [Staphylococcus aureus]
FRLCCWFYFPFGLVLEVLIFYLEKFAAFRKRLFYKWEWIKYRPAVYRFYGILPGIVIGLFMFRLWLHSLLLALGMVGT